MNRQRIVQLILAARWIALSSQKEEIVTSNGMRSSVGF